MDEKKRSFAKTISWRITGSTSTFLITYAISGNLVASTSVAIIQVIANTLLFWFHERVWNRINWGRSIN